MPDAGRSEQINLIPAAATVLLLILAAAFRFPYSFYTLLRVTVCLVSLYCASQAHAAKRTFWVWCFAASAIIFNPLIPLRMSRSDWRVLNIGDAALFAVWCVWLQVPNRSTQRWAPLTPEQKDQVLDDLRQHQLIEAKLEEKTSGKVQ